MWTSSRRRYFLKAAGAADGMDVDPGVIDAAGDLGGRLSGLHGAGGRYAYAGRDWVCGRVAKILGATITEEVHNHHNFAWRETHGGKDLWVVRKGATPAFPGQRGFVGGTMGEISLILKGVENESAAESLYSTVHGAGRVLGRLQAKGTFDRKDRRCQVRRAGHPGDDGRLGQSRWCRTSRGRARRVPGLLTSACRKCWPSTPIPFGFYTHSSLSAWR